jgi:hypothetical protein
LLVPGLVISFVFAFGHLTLAHAQIVGDGGVWPGGDPFAPSETGGSGGKKAVPVNDSITGECAAKNKMVYQECLAANQKDPVRAKICYEQKKYIPYESAKYDDAGKIIGTPLISGTASSKAVCITKMSAKEKYGNCADACDPDSTSFKGIAEVPNGTYPGYTRCGVINEMKSDLLTGSLLYCRQRNVTPAKTQVTKMIKSGTLTEDIRTTGTTTVVTTGTNTGAGTSFLGGLATGLGQGIGQGIGAILGTSLSQKLFGNSGSTSGNSNAVQLVPTCSDPYASQRPECNPALPTEPPRCIQDSFSASPSVIYLGQTSTLSWALLGKGTIITAISYVTRDKDNKQIKGTLGIVTGGTIDVSPELSTTYTLKATNEIGSVTCPPVRVSVRPKTEDDEPQVDSDPNAFSVRCVPDSIVKGESAEVEWEQCPSDKTTSIRISSEDLDFSYDQRTNTGGSHTVSPLKDTTYVGRCLTNEGKELARKSCSIMVSDPLMSDVDEARSRPSVQIAADPQSVGYGEKVTVSWKSKNTTGCIVYGPGCAENGREHPKCYKELGRAGAVTGSLYTTTHFIVECKGVDRKSMATDEAVASIEGDSPILEE